MKYSAKIIGTGMYVPKRIITNKYLEKFIDTSDKWIQEKTGIKKRRVSEKGELGSDLSAKSAVEAIKNADLMPEDIELIILATTYPDMTTPATAAIVQKKIGAKNAAIFDIRNGCQGFLTGLITASKFISDSTYKNALIIGTTQHAKLFELTGWKDRTKAVFFGDGSGAVVLKRCETNKGILTIDMGNEKDKSHLINLPFGGMASFENPNAFEDPILGKPMEGKEVFNFATTNVPVSIKKTLEKIGKKLEDLDFIILHQANINIIKHIMNSLNLPMEKTYVNINKYANMAEASIPVALHEAIQAEKIKSGDLVALTGFGVGMGWATVVIKWG
ncbi:ketoacyl-ACP synthase III [Candidatus Pacearchaeota archaeon]|nr:ketoacyl-ACP synthase III [Candidatus Pacearchaeota archaeon]